MIGVSKVFEETISALLEESMSPSERREARGLQRPEAKEERR
jgi:hypothetical protein